MTDRELLYRAQHTISRLLIHAQNARLIARGVDSGEADRIMLEQEDATDLLRAMRDRLAEPEVKRVPMTEDEAFEGGIYDLLSKENEWRVRQAIREVEAHHGIT